MDLNLALTSIATQIGCNATQLIKYAQEDTLGGYHIDISQRTFPQGSLWGVEGQILYAIARILKPKIIAEIGGFSGASATHLALAVSANKIGHIYSIDNGVGGADHGALLPPDLRPHITLITANGEDWLLTQNDHSIGLIFEDATHGTELVALLTKIALQKLKRGGILANHDAAHDFAYVGGGVKVNSTVGAEVRAGLDIAGANYKVYLAEPSDCGLAITVA